MKHSKIDFFDLTERLDAEFYRPEFLANQKLLVELGCAVPLNDALKSIQLGYTGPTEIYYDPDGIYYLSSKNIVNGNLEIEANTDKIGLEFHNGKLSKTKVFSGDVLISRTGTVGKCALIGGEDKEFNIAAHLIALRINNDFDSAYISCFINSSFGKSQSVRLQRGTIIQGLSIFDVPNMLIPKYPKLTQSYIGNKVRQAELLREKCTQIELLLNGEMSTIFWGKPKPTIRAFKRQAANVLTHNRLDPDFYSLASMWSETEIKNGPNYYNALGELTTRIKDGPGGWGVSTNDYRPHGVPVIRSVNIVNGECDLTDCVFISEEKHQELIGHEAKKGSVVLSVRGTVGRAAVFEDDMVNSASLNAAVVTIDCKDNLNPYYLAAFFNSSVGNGQANRIANGAVQLNMNLTETASNLIPLPPIDIQEKIESIYRKLISARKFNRMLSVASKALVEALIEGKVTETEIIAAQQALENNDNTKDRAILSKLTDKGYAVKEAKPLFSDLDALYELLEEAQQYKGQD